MNHVMTDGTVNDTPSNATTAPIGVAEDRSGEPDSGSDRTFPSGPAGTTRHYLDAAAVAPMHPAAREAMLAALDDGWADPRRLHREGSQARLLLDGARESIAASLGARTPEVGFTGSHVLAVHAAVLGTLRARRRAGTTAVISAVEHSAVMNATAHGATDVTQVPVDAAGRVDLDQFVAAVQSYGTAIACLQSANGEVGTRQPVAAAAEAAAAVGVPLLVDAAASIGHDEPPEAWDLLVADPRAWGAPAGLGVFAIRERTRWLAAGPEHDGLERVAGEVFVPAALAAAVALEAVTAERAREAPRRRRLVAELRAAAAAVPDVEVVGDGEDRLPHVTTFSCLYVDGEVLVGELDRAGYAVGSGSACTAASLRPSHVLAAMGVLTHGNVRVGLPVGVAEDAVRGFCAALPGAVARVRAMLGAADL
jgi:cysteine desulfurase